MKEDLTFKEYCELFQLEIEVRKMQYQKMSDKKMLEHQLFEHLPTELFEI